MQADMDDVRPATARLIYRSRAVLDRGPSEPMAVLLDLVTRARIRNNRNGITGLLLYDGEMFLQVLEGPLPAVEKTFETIACDQRHKDIELIDLAMVEGRDYTAWTMAMLDASNDRYPRLAPFMSRGGEARTADLRHALAEALHNTAPDECDILEPA